MAILDVLITIDAKTIVENYGNNNNPNSPRPISADLIHMDAKKSQVVSSPGSIELTIQATPGDYIRWRETTLSMNFEYTGMLYDFVLQSGVQLISKPVPRRYNRMEPVPVETDPLNPTLQKVASYVWESGVEDTGTVVYTFKFMILDNKGNKLGYYTWDPKIIIKD